MSDPQTDLILRYFKRQSQPPGQRMTAPLVQSSDRTQQYTGLDRFQQVEKHLGRKAKRTIDKSRTSHKHHLAHAVFSPVLNHYEDMDWWERDSSYDFYSQIDGPAK